MSFTLHPYQREAVRFISRPGGSGLFLDMGLGKTAISLSALTPDMLPALVTAPKRVAENVWQHEAAIWRPDLTIAVAKGNPAARERALLSGADIVVISRDNLADAVPFAKGFTTFIIDELSGFKSRASKRWKFARQIVRSPSVSRVWGLTGTPAPNNLLDLWAQLYLLDGGEALGTTLGGYRERYFTEDGRLPSGIVTGYKPRPGAPERIHALLERTCLSMESAGRVDLPPITVNDVEVPLTPTVRRIYKTMKDEMIVNLDILGGEIHTSESASGVSAKLAQITAGFMYVDNADLRDGAWDVIHREKMRALQEIVDGTGSPVLVAYWYKAEEALIRETLGHLVHDMDEPNVQERWNAGEFPVLMVHPASAGHGLNLQHGGHTIVWTSLPWSLELYQQTNKRLPRQGQKHPVIVHRLMSPGTVDYAKADVLEEKKTIQQALLDHLESPI